MQAEESHRKVVLHPEISDVAFQELRKKLFHERCLDLMGYKNRCIRRRIAVRLRARQCRNLDEYLDILINEPQEIDNLIQAITINVSGFFRNAETFDLIRDRIIPNILAWRDARGQKELKLWSAGCATGEEVYSLAILLKHHFKGPINSKDVLILGTDFNEEFLERARQGEYLPDRVEDVPEELRKRYFRQKGESLVLAPRIRDMVTLEKQDLLEDSPDHEFDMILCRNVLIYLSREIQEKLFTMFFNVLRLEGFLVLGKTETLLEPARTGFRSIIPRERVYQKIASA